MNTDELLKIVARIQLSAIEMGLYTDNSGASEKNAKAWDDLHRLIDAEQDDLK